MLLGDWRTDGVYQTSEIVCTASRIETDYTYYFPNYTSAEFNAGFYQPYFQKDKSTVFAVMGVHGGNTSGGGKQGAGPRTQNPLPQGNGSNSQKGFVVNKYGKIKANNDSEDKNIYYSKDDGTIVTLG